MNRLRAHLTKAKAGAIAARQMLRLGAPSNHLARETLLHDKRAEATSPSRANLASAIEWIKHAQDASGCHGICWGFRTISVKGRRAGWVSAYPETSGYIIETLIRYGKQNNDTDALARAQRIADWEVGIQLPDGGIQGGRIDATPVESSTFVTGQVLFGFVAAFEEFASDGYAKAAERAGRYLLDQLDTTGRFQSGYSHFCAPGPKAYEVRTGWAMLRAGMMLSIPQLVRGGISTAEFALACQKPNGWFELNDLDVHDRPLTHTIGYTLEGLHAIGVLADRPEFIRAVRKTLLEISRLIGEDGHLPGRWTSEWRPAVSWVCLTGSAQIALVALRMHALFPSDGFNKLGEYLLRFVTKTQNLQSKEAGLRGGIHGSYPLSGEYGSYANLNWAAKFYADALLEMPAERLELAQSGRRT